MIQFVYIVYSDSFRPKTNCPAKTMLWLSAESKSGNNVKRVKKITQDVLSMFQVTVSQPTGPVPVNRTTPAPEKTAHG